MLGGIILDRVDSITDWRVVRSFDVRMSFSTHINVTVVAFCEKIVSEFRNPYTLRTLYVSLLHPKLEYA
jgi:hypothetical protein